MRCRTADRLRLAASLRVVQSGQLGYNPPVPAAIRRGVAEALRHGDHVARVPQVRSGSTKGVIITPSLRIGIGHDTHRLADGGPLRLGGIEIPFHRHLVGHSDADVLLHAITDALLGAAALGDIGDLFPDTAPEHRNRDSADMLAEAYGRVVFAGYRASNVDCIVFAEHPKLAGHKPQICQRIAEILGMPATGVGVKAKTGEGVGVVGSQQAISAQAVVLLEKTEQ